MDEAPVLQVDEERVRATVKLLRGRPAVRRILRELHRAGGLRFRDVAIRAGVSKGSAFFHLNGPVLAPLVERATIKKNSPRFDCIGKAVITYTLTPFGQRVATRLNQEAAE